MSAASMLPADRQAKRLERFRRAFKRAAQKNDWRRTSALVEGLPAGLAQTPEAMFARAVVCFHDHDLAQAATLAERLHQDFPSVREYADFLAVVHGLVGDISSAAYFGKLATVAASLPAARELLPESFPSLPRVLCLITEKPLLRRAAAALVAGAWEQAEIWFRQHLHFEPDCRQGFLGLASSLLARELPFAAADALRAGLHRRPGDARLASLLGRALSACGRLDEAAAVHRWAAEIAGEDPAIHAAALVDRLRRPGLDAADAAASFRAWGARFGIDDHGLPAEQGKALAGRLKVGFVIADRAGTGAGPMLARILSHLDRRRFWAVGFGFGALTDGANVILQKCFETWHDVREADPLTLTALVLGEAIHILVDLAGFSAPTLITAFGSRMAPCQSAWLDSAEGTGLAAMDFLLTDRFVEAGGRAGAELSETPVFLDLGCVIAAPGDRSAGFDDRSDDGQLVLAANVSLAELTPATVACWSHILMRLPGSVLTLRDRQFRDGDAANYLTGLFGSFGMADRVDVVSGEPSALYAAADIALMPLSMGQPQAVIEGLNAGLPVITWAGSCRHHRLAASLLHHCQLPAEMWPGMIAETEDQYVALALAWARAADARRCLRRQAPALLGRAAVFDGRARARDLERALETMWAATVVRTGTGTTELRQRVA